MFKTPKPRQFDYKPMYYDEAKEEREKKYKRIRAEGEGGEYFSMFPKSQLESCATTRHSSRIRSNIRLIIIIIALAGLAYYIIQF